MLRGSLYLVLAIVIFLGLWEATYPDSGDPKNLHYVAWKWHLLPMDPMRALGVMTHDSYSERLVLGKTPDQLEKRFGFVQTVSQVGPYLRDYCAAARPGSSVLFLYNSNYMVVMQNNHVFELVLCKG
jgi:hypothetical protein